jgi:hypothetical protein
MARSESDVERKFVGPSFWPYLVHVPCGSRITENAATFYIPLTWIIEQEILSVTHLSRWAGWTL